MEDLKRSKVYRYSLGHVWFRAPTVAELIAYLSQYPADMPVLATWDGTIHAFNFPEVDEIAGAPALVFDVEFDDTEEPV